MQRPPSPASCKCRATAPLFLAMVRWFTLRPLLIFRVMHLSHPRRFLVGVTGGIAAYKVAELTRLMMQEGCEVEVVMTEAAMRLVGPATFQALTGKPVFSDLWDPRAAGGMAHIELLAQPRRDHHRAGFRRFHRQARARLRR